MGNNNEGNGKKTVLQKATAKPEETTHFYSEEQINAIIKELINILSDLPPLTRERGNEGER